MPYSPVMQEKLANIAKQSGGYSAFARKLGVRPQTLLQWCNGQRPIPIRRALDIERASGGKLKAVELFPDIYGPRQEAA